MVTRRAARRPAAGLVDHRYRPAWRAGQPLGNSLPDTTPVVFITYTSEQPELPSARRFAVLHKPFELAQLSDLVARMLAGTPLSR